MSIVARLPGGIEISFPEGTSDKEMDRRIKEFVNSQSAERHDLALHLVDIKGELKNLTMAITQAMSQSNENIKLSLLGAIKRQAHIISRAMDGAMSVVSEEVARQGDRIVETLEEPKDIVFDPKTGKPTGTKRKAR